MKYIFNGSTDPYFNMAFDEWCLENLDPTHLVFRLWRNVPSVIIGYNQDARAEVNLEYLEENGILLARRVTGGGAVYHDLQNLNYSIWGRNASPEPFVQALRHLGLDAQLTGRNDVFVDGRKVSGYAKSLRKDNVLVHGTLMWDVDIDVLTKALDTPQSKLNRKGVASVRSRVRNIKDCLPQIDNVEMMALELKKCFAPTGEITLTESQLKEIAELARNKFGVNEWILGKTIPE